VSLVLGGCGSSTGHQTNAPVAQSNAACQPGARQVIATAVSASTSAVSGRVTVATSGDRRCTFAAVGSAGHRFRAIIDIYEGPQPYFILERTAIEDAQTFTPKPLHPPPLSISGLGLEADWFPQYPYLMVTDGFRMLTVTVIWPGHSQASRRQLAIAISKPYLHTPHGKRAQELANGYPSG